MGGTGLYNNNTQYYDTTGPIADRSTLGRVYLDTSPYPASGCHFHLTPDGCLTYAQLEAEVVKAIGANGWTPGLSHLFFVYLSYGEGSCVTESPASGCFLGIWCAYHATHSTVSGQPMLWALVPYLGTDLSFCSLGFAPNNDVGADSAINATSYEQMESVTDPLYTAWISPNGYEIGDNCNWNFGAMSFDNGQANQAWGPNGKHYYAMQQEWSNASNGCVQAGP